MISDVDRTLRSMLMSEISLGESLDVSFDAPTRDWSARRTGPVLNLFLADLRENLDRRSSDLAEVRDENGVVVARRQRDRVFALTYALTAWTSSAEDDHELLSAALECLLRHDCLPQEHAAGVVSELGSDGRLPAVVVGLPSFSDKLATELWGAVGADYRPTLWVVIEVPVSAGPSLPVGPPQTQPPVYSFSDQAAALTERVLGTSPDEPARVRTRTRDAAPLP